MRTRSVGFTRARRAKRGPRLFTLFPFGEKAVGFTHGYSRGSPSGKWAWRTVPLRKLQNGDVKMPLRPSPARCSAPAEPFPAKVSAI